MSKLDILTPKGCKSARDEEKASKHLIDYGIQYIATPKNKPAVIDAVLVNGSKIVGVAETKCRYNITFMDFLCKYGNRWLLTESKVQECLKVARALCVPLIGLLYLVDDDCLMMINLSLAPRIISKTKTQATINGGQAIRNNAYVDMTRCRVSFGQARSNSITDLVNYHEKTRE